MKLRKLGRTGLKVSPICLGTMTMGSQVAEAESIEIIRSAIDMGINFLDTADGYSRGKSEDIIGKAVKGNRDSVVIATKVGAQLPPDPGVNLSRKYILKTIEDSLRRLQTDYIDLYYCHFPDYDTPLDETLRAMDDLVRQGKVRYIGCSNFKAWMLCKALWVSDRYRLARFDCIEPPYNLLTRDIEFELLPLCESEGIGVCVFNPLAGEMLTGRHEFGKPPAEGRFTLEDMGKMYMQRYWNEKNFEAVERFKKLAVKHGLTLAQFAMAWILNNSTITSVLSGVTTVQQLEENLKAVEVVLTEEDLKVCDEMWQIFSPPRFMYGK
ncbi:MAG: aldo/keto reductase [Deltaproteobacteria bacterium]|nr:aldo/keto reductase [Deltaproteobacteria bacterium]